MVCIFLLLLAVGAHGAAWQMPAGCGPDPDIVETPRNWIEHNYELNKTDSYPAGTAARLFHAPDTLWQQAVEAGVCDDTWARYKVVCREAGGGRRVLTFPPGSLFEITRQVVLPPNLVLEGAADPNPGGADGDHRRRPDPLAVTFFWSRPSNGPDAFFQDGKPRWCGCSWADPSGAAECTMATPEQYRLWRKGFLMNTNTTARMFLYDGAVEDGMDDCDGGLGGGGAFELPGCLTSYPAPKGVVGCGVASDNSTPVHAGGAFVTGNGKAVENVVIEDIRLADGLPGYGVKSMLSIWTAFPPDGQSHRNLTVRRLVSMGSGKVGAAGQRTRRRHDLCCGGCAVGRRVLGGLLLASASWLAGRSAQSSPRRHGTRLRSGAPAAPAPLPSGRNEHPRACRRLPRGGHVHRARQRRHVCVLGGGRCPLLQQADPQHQAGAALRPLRQIVGSLLGHLSDVVWLWWQL